VISLNTAYAATLFCYFPSTSMFVVKSYINNWNESTSEFVKSVLDDESFHVVAMTRVNKKLFVDSLLARLMGKDQ
jgi:hypothetical protein